MVECDVGTGFRGFEGSNLCDYSIDTSSSYTWIWQQGPAPQPNSGPQTGDHTTGTDNGHYMLSR